MKSKIFLLVLLLCIQSNAQTTFKTMFYNILNYPTAPPTNRNTILKNILNDYQPDIFMVCELESEIASEDILNYSLGEINKNYAKATFVYNQSDTSTDSNLQQGLFYNSDYFTLINQEEILTNIRDINHYTLKLNTFNQNSNPILLEIFVTHLKASQGTTNEQKRFEMVQQFTNALNNLDPNSYVIFAGDFNFYTSSENGYQEILNPNNTIIMKDVVNMDNSLQSWHTNYNWKEIHTQSTRLSNSGFSGYGAGGGLDDRFDFIILSESITNDSTINYVANSYKSYGNNQNCYNKRIDDTSCSGEFSQEMRNNLYNMSDHLPVTLELTSNETLHNNSYTNKTTFYLKGNLVSKKLKIVINNAFLRKKVLIANTLGQIILEKKITQNDFEINVSNLKKGVYFLKIESHKLPFIKK